MFLLAPLSFPLLEGWCASSRSRALRLPQRSERASESARSVFSNSPPDFITRTLATALKGNSIL
jgi:hypothetical protein